jgi:hypothetical protein
VYEKKQFLFSGCTDTEFLKKMRLAYTQGKQSTSFHHWYWNEQLKTETTILRKRIFKQSEKSYSMFKYCIITWLVANILHPFVMLIFFQADNSLISGEGIESVFMMFLVMLIFSIPSLLISLVVLNLISLLSMVDAIKFFIWIAAAILIIAANLFLIFNLFDGTKMMKLSDFEIGIPAMISVTLANLVRFPYFFKDIQQLKTNRESDK